MKNILSVIVTLIVLTSCEKEVVIPTPNIPNTPVSDGRIIYKEFVTSFSKWNKSGVDINSPILIDYDNNGRYDIIVSQRKANRIGNTYTYELLNPILISDSDTKRELTNVWKGGGPVTSGDFNGDGYIDIAEFDNGPEFYDIEPTPAKTDLLIWWNSKNGLTGESTFVDKIIHNSYNMSAADLDGDGKAELVRMDFPNYDNYFKFNGKTFDKLPIQNLPNVTNAGLVFGDFDNDKKMDAISSAFGSPSILWNFLNNTSKTPLTIPKGLGINNTVSGDFDKDGYNDIIFICQKEDAGGQIFENKHYYLYYKNDGKNNYNLIYNILPEYTSYIEPNCPLFLVKDIDADGDLDFYNVNTDFDEIFINDGKGNFKRYNKLGYGI